MEAKKVIEVNETSIVDLRAELFRKEQQFRQESGVNKVKSERSTSKKPPIWSKPTKPTSKGHSNTQNIQDYEDQSEEQKALQKSRKMLEAKAVLYEKMATGEIEDNDEQDGEEGRFLVDFHKKSFSEVMKSKQDDEDSEDVGPPTPPPTCPEEEWIDYVDSLGRSRRCLKKDLSELQNMEKDIKPPRSPSPPTLLSEDMRREIMRKKWEKEEEEAMNRPVGPVHYQNIRFDEVRNHGVGYYQFSTVEDERQKQMETLNELREETKDQRSRIERIKDKRKAALDARLAKVRARKKIKTGETGEEEESKPTDVENVEVNNEIPEPETAQDSVVSSKEEKVADKSDEETDRSSKAKKKQIPEWARHKIKQPDFAKSYVNQRREERLHDFAPPTFYYDSATTTESNTCSKRNPKQRVRGRERRAEQTELTRQDNDSNSQDMNTAASAANQDTLPINQQWTAPPYYPPHPPPVGSVIPPIPPPPVDYSHPPPVGSVIPPIPPPPVDYSHPPPGIPLFPPPFNYTAMPPPYPLPPWQPLSRQQNPQWQGEATNTNTPQPCQFPPTPYQPLPGQPFPGQPFPGQPFPGQPFPGQPFPRQPLPRQPFPGQPFPGQPFPGQPFPGQPLPGQPLPGQPFPGQSNQETSNQETSKVSTENVCQQFQTTVDSGLSRDDNKLTSTASNQNDDNNTLHQNNSATNTTEKKPTSETTPSAEAVADFVSSIRRHQST